ncbi:MAG TPA: twin-arginine translocation signal domain-containing protein, partial [Caldilineaceae bacterium]|nr:twin-arginine translocation signal domain-containing protein [Caldilineaceae bacterium]
MLSRRDFIKASIATGASMWFAWHGSTLHVMQGGAVPRVLAQIPGGTLDPGAVPKYQMPLLIPPVMPKAGTISQ